MPHLTAQPDAVKVLHKRIALCEDPFVEQMFAPWWCGGVMPPVLAARECAAEKAMHCARRAGTAGRSGKSGVVVSLYAKHGKWGNQVYMWRLCMKLSAQRKRVALTGPFEALNIP